VEIAMLLNMNMERIDIRELTATEAEEAMPRRLRNKEDFRSSFIWMSRWRRGRRRITTPRPRRMINRRRKQRGMELTMVLMTMRLTDYDDDDDDDGDA